MFEFLSEHLWIFGFFFAGGTVVLTAFFLRTVVPTNEVHIVQSSKATTSYGKDTKNGNTYYKWPAFIPVLGVNTVVMPMSVFDLDLEDYEAFDEGRLPFTVDVKAFFRISDSNIAAQRVSTFAELTNQLHAVVQGSVRSILAQSTIEEIMKGRSKFGDAFTKEVDGELVNWGVQTVKNIELMDMRDAHGSEVIKNIMDKKKSHIEMESRTEVANNKRAAQEAEISAQQSISVKEAAAKEVIGIRQIAAQRTVELATQEKNQIMQEQAKITTEKTLEVTRVQTLKTAEITREAKIIEADQEKQIAITYADAKLQSEKMAAQAVSVQGQAKAEAEKAMLMAPVHAQTELADKIGANKEYQAYLLSIREIEAKQAIGVEQAKALVDAEIKIIANTGDNVSSGIGKVTDLFSSKGGTALGAMLEGMANTDKGKKLLEKVIN